MKKLFLLVAFVAIASTAANAQFDRSKYQGEIDLGYTVGFSDSYGRINLRTVHGFRFNQYFFAGIGAGIDVYHGVVYLDADGLDTKARFALPIYVNAKGYLPVASRLDLFLGIDLGYSIGLSPKKDNSMSYTMSGLMFQPELGIAYELNNGKAVSFAIGGAINSMKLYIKGDGETVTDRGGNHGLSLRLGYIF